jgi:hypothetical protein
VKRFVYQLTFADDHRKTSASGEFDDDDL